jgi:hypothetical protein
MIIAHFLYLFVPGAAVGVASSSSVNLCDSGVPVYREKTSLRGYIFAWVWRHHPLGNEHSILSIGISGHSKQNSSTIFVHVPYGSLLSNDRGHAQHVAASGRNIVEHVLAVLLLPLSLFLESQDQKARPYFVDGTCSNLFENHRVLSLGVNCIVFARAL